MGNGLVYVISDLHMGDGGPRDNFAIADRAQQLDRFLDYVAGRQGALVIVGDLFDFWQMNLSRILTIHKPLLDRLAEMNATYVVGNHDADLVHFIGTGFLGHCFFQRMCGPFERRIGPKRFKFMHGHEVDPVNSGDSPKWGRVFSIVAGLLEERNGSPLTHDGDFVEDDLETVGEHVLGPFTRLLSRTSRTLCMGRLGIPEEYLTPAQNPKRAGDLLAMYRQDQAQAGYDVAIVGHTHRAGRAGQWYFNSGTWARKANSFLEIQPEGEVQVFDWTAGKPVANATVLGE
jgi:UDP-2,3-diacylglucosamine pyrophosphatase LpxH